jgi:hypothetical protein
VLHREDVEEIVERDYLIVKIDLQRMTNGSEVGRRLRAGGGGIPWYVILDAKGEKLITSDGKDGNIGYPTNDDDLAHFRKMLTKTAKRLSAEQVDTIADAFKKKPDKPKPEPKPEVSARAGG